MIDLLISLVFGTLMAIVWHWRELYPWYQREEMRELAPRFLRTLVLCVLLLEAQDFFGPWFSYTMLVAIAVAWCFPDLYPRFRRRRIFVVVPKFLAIILVGVLLMETGAWFDFVYLLLLAVYFVSSDVYPWYQRRSMFVVVPKFFGIIIAGFLIMASIEVLLPWAAYGVTPLHTVSQEGYANGALAYVNAGIDVNAKTDVGETPLHYAAAANSADTVRALVFVGADVKATNVDGETPLHIAALLNNVYAARALIDAGADIDARGPWDTTPLMRAVQHSEATQFFVDAGADVHTVSFTGSSLLHQASIMGNAAVIELLLSEGFDPNLRNYANRVPLHYSFHADATQLLLAAGADMWAEDEWGKTPLDYNSVEIASELF